MGALSFLNTIPKGNTRSLTQFFEGTDDENSESSSGSDREDTVFLQHLEIVRKAREEREAKIREEEEAKKKIEADKKEQKVQEEE